MLLSSCFVLQALIRNYYKVYYKNKAKADILNPVTLGTILRDTKLCCTRFNLCFSQLYRKHSLQALTASHY